jgi:hypothetical protein
MSASGTEINDLKAKIQQLEEQLDKTADAQERTNLTSRITAYINLLASYQTGMNNITC